MSIFVHLCLKNIGRKDTDFLLQESDFSNVGFKLILYLCRFNKTYYYGKTIL